MQEHALHHVPVLDDRENLVGIVAERDLLLAATHHLQAVVEVGEVMHRDVVTTTRDTPLAEAAALMVDHRIGGLPVLDAKQRVVGVITETDIFRAFVAHRRCATATPRRKRRGVSGAERCHAAVGASVSHAAVGAHQDHVGAAMREQTHGHHAGDLVDRRLERRGSSIVRPATSRITLPLSVVNPMRHAGRPPRRTSSRAT